MIIIQFLRELIELIKENTGECIIMAIIALALFSALMDAIIKIVEACFKALR